MDCEAELHDHEYDLKPMRHPYGDHGYAQIETSDNNDPSSHREHGDSSDIHEEASRDDVAIPPQVPTLSDEMLRVIDEALLASPAQVVANVCGQRVTRDDLVTLTDLNWLNDVIINAYLKLIVNRSKNNPDSPTVYAFDVFLLKMYDANGYGAVRSWTTRTNIFAHHILLFPIIMNDHWSMAMVDLRSREIKHMDSMGGRNDSCLLTLLGYLDQEMRDKHQCDLVLDEWTLVAVDNLPQQQNGSDCGAFALKFADYGAQDAIINFTQADMPYFRHRMMFEILEAAILPSGYQEISI